MKLFDLTGKYAVVTGANGSIGSAICEGFREAGATVFDWDLPEIDVRNVNNCKSAFEMLPGLDVMVNAAGVTDDEAMDVNLIGAAECCCFAGTVMHQKGSGSIINITSLAAHVGLPNNLEYAMSKGGLSALTKSLAIDLRPVRVNNIVPGYIHTAMTEKSYKNPKAYKKRLKRTILGRWGEPEDLVGAAIFLASDASSYVTGTDIVVDGGWLAKGL